MWYAPHVDWSERRREGFALAAAARGDRGATLGAAGLSTDITREATSVAARLAASEVAVRRSWVREVLERRAELGADEAPCPRPSRALSLIAPSVDVELGRRWLRDAPLPRAGYVPEPRLLVLLRKLVVHTQRRAAGGGWRA